MDIQEIETVEEIIEKELEENYQSENLWQIAHKNLKKYAQNRELSWLKFNERVLLEALDSDVPAFEKLKFVSIFTSNLEEFFMVRVGSLTDLSLLKNPKKDNKTGMSVKEQLKKIMDEVKRLFVVKDRVYKNVDKILRDFGIYDLEFDELSKSEKRIVEEYYKDYIKPIVSPQIVDHYHPFPFLENNQLYIIAELSTDSKEMFGILPIPKSLPNFLHFDKSRFRFIRTENIFLQYAKNLFPNYKAKNLALIMVTRNADLTAEEERDTNDQDYREQMQKILKKRKRLQAVRILSDIPLSDKATQFLCENLNMNKSSFFSSNSPLKMQYVYELINKLPLDLCRSITYEEFTPCENPLLDSKVSLIEQILKTDYLFEYPYEDINQFINLLDEAATDPRVLSIKLTIYRLSQNSKIVQKLIKAAQNGKDVTVLIELRARFDEQNNIDYSKELYEAGCNIIYGLPYYKCHSKVCLITLKDKDDIKYITQFGTGNYNEITSKLYTDLSLITCDYDMGVDALEFFTNMSLENLEGDYSEILVAPKDLKPKLMELIDSEIEKGEDGRLFFKINSLTDKDFLIKFAQASMAGVKIKLIIRGICCLIPGIDGLTENIEVRSIVGRFLEHSRVYKFGEGEDSKFFISSADLMTRNTERRIEVAAPIKDLDIKRKLDKYMRIQWKDNRKARRLRSNALYDYIAIDNSEDAFSSQEYMINNAKQKFEKSLERRTSKNIFTRLIEYIKNVFK